MASLVRYRFCGHMNDTDILSIFEVNLEVNLPSNDVTKLNVDAACEFRGRGETSILSYHLFEFFYFDDGDILTVRKRPIVRRSYKPDDRNINDVAEIKYECRVPIVNNNNRTGRTTVMLPVN